MENNKKFCVRRMQPEDIASVAELEKECFSMPWSQKSLEESLKSEMYTFLVAVDDEQVAGYAGIYYTLSEGNITNVAVRSDYRKKGVGTKLLEHMIMDAHNRRCESIFLEVRQSNEPAILLYEKMEFKIVGVRKKFYQKPTEDALVLQKITTVIDEINVL